MAGCATAGSQGGGGGDEDGPIKIGFIGALSGGSAPMGVAGQHGIQLAVEELNADGGIDGREIEMIFVDDKADPATAATGAQKLVTSDQVAAVIGGPNSGTVKAMIPIVTGADTPILISIAQNDALVDPDAEGFPLTFRMTENNSYDIGAIAELFKQRGYQTICAVADTSAYGQGGLDSITAVFEQKGLTLAHSAQHPVGATDMTAQALTLRDAGCDAVYLYSLGPDGALFMKTLDQISWDVPVVGGRGLAMKSFISLGGAATDGIVIPSTIDPAKPAATAYVEAYDESFGADDDPAHVYSALGYDSMNVLAQALRETGGAGGPELAEALEGLDGLETVSGKQDAEVGFGPDKHVAPGDDFLVFYEIKGGEYTFLTDDVQSGLEQ